MSHSNLENYEYFCESIESPPLYIKVSFYSLIASCLERRVWIPSGDGIFGNLYLILVGDPASGKTNAAKINKSIISKLYKQHPKNPTLLIPAINLAPDSTTVEQLITKLANLTTITVTKQGIPYGHSSITVVSEELGNLIKVNDENLTSFFIQAYDGSDYLKETKHRGCDKVVKPCVNFIAGTTPTWLNKSMSRSLLSDGFLGRAIFIWGGSGKKKTFFEASIDQIKALDAVKQHCEYLLNLCGPVNFSTEAKEFLTDWYENKSEKESAGFDKSLKHYFGRKKINAIKLALLHHHSSFPIKPEIGATSIEAALKLLREIEISMHLCFAGSGSNPIYKLANNIYGFLKHVDRAFTRTQIANLFFDECSVTGTTQDINNALEYLIMSQKIVVYSGDDKEPMMKAIKEDQK